VLAQESRAESPIVKKAKEQVNREKPSMNEAAGRTTPLLNDILMQPENFSS